MNYKDYCYRRWTYEAQSCA